MVAQDNSTSDTIFALSSGAPPAAIAVVRISGPEAGAALRSLAGRLPPPRRVSQVALRGSDGELLDRALGLWLPGPGTVTGEDIAELHCHGGRAIVAAIEAELDRVPGLRRAAAGEFTRRAFANGKIDLAEAEGLADLLSAETELQRRSAMAVASGALSRLVDDWCSRLLAGSAQLEAVLDFSDEDDVEVLPAGFARFLLDLGTEIADWLARPRADALRDGIKVVIAGPPNSGKSTLFNVLVGSEAAIATPIAGTTRDVLTRPVSVDGVPFVFTDTAGLREFSDDPIETIGIDRARSAAAEADIVLWLGSEGQGPPGAWEVEPQIDRVDRPGKQDAQVRVSAVSGAGIDQLRGLLVRASHDLLPKPGEPALNERHARLLGEAATMLESAAELRDPLLIAEHLRLARVAMDAMLGRATTEHMLDALFGRFCIGK
jgi:tRNA modification GTPase